MPSGFEIIVKSNNVGDVLAKIQKAKDRSLEKVGLAAEGYAKRLCPVDTGNLRNSITHTRDNNSAYIGTNVEYAPYVELGTRKMSAQPFLVPAARDHWDEYSAIFEETFRNS